MDYGMEADKKLEAVLDDSYVITDQNAFSKF